MQMRIKLNLNIFLFFIIFLLKNQIEIYALVMLFAFIHELAHMFLGIILGYKPEILKIMPYGFCIEFKAMIGDYNKKIIKSNLLAVKKIIIALAGPIINLLIVVLGIILDFNSNIMYSNLLIFLFNLIPIHPLDGARIVNNILKIFFGNRKANKYMNHITNTLFILLTAISSILVLIYKNISILIIIMVIWSLVIKENRKYYTYNKIYKIIDKTYN